MSAIGTTAATSHLLLRPQSKYGLVHLMGPGTSSAPLYKKCLILENTHYISLTISL